MHAAAGKSVYILLGIYDDWSTLKPAELHQCSPHGADLETMNHQNNCLFMSLPLETTGLTGNSSREQFLYE